MRSINSVSISFGLVSVPVKVYTSASSESVKFNMLTPAGNRVKQKYTDAVTGQELEFKDCDKGYEISTDQFVRFTSEDMKALEAEKSKVIEIKEFVDASSVGDVYVEKNYYLGPDKGGDKGYLLLSETMKSLGKVAVAQWNSRGREHLVVIRPYKNGLLLQEMFYANEVRDFSEIPVAKVNVFDQEREMAAKLVQALSSGAFDPSKYSDSYGDRVKAAVERKLAGKSVEVSAAPKKDNVLDLLAALQASVDAVSKK